MCVGRYAEKIPFRFAPLHLFCMPAIDISGCCIPAECDNIKLPYNGEIASRWDAYLLCDICRHFASVMLRLASLISHNLRCIPAYTHQIPMGFFLAHNSDIILNINHLERTRNIASLPCETVLGDSLFVLGRGLCPDISQIYSIFAPENINAT